MDAHRYEFFRVSEKENIGTISGFAWGLGFVGGLISLGISFFIFDFSNSIENPSTDLVRFFPSATSQLAHNFSGF